MSAESIKWFFSLFWNGFFSLGFRNTLHTNLQIGGSKDDPNHDEDNETDDEGKRKYSISDVISQIKRSIPDLRSVKHQPLENKGKHKYILSNFHLSHYLIYFSYINPASPTDSPRSSHMKDGRPLVQQKQQQYQQEKEVDAVTLSAITSVCSCGGGPKSMSNRKVISDGADMFEHSATCQSHTQQQPHQPHQYKTDESDHR